MTDLRAAAEALLHTAQIHQPNFETSPVDLSLELKNVSISLQMLADYTRYFYQDLDIFRKSLDADTFFCERTLFPWKAVQSVLDSCHHKGCDRLILLC